LFENSRFHGQLGIIVRLNDIGICKTALGITTCVETAYSEESSPVELISKSSLYRVCCAGFLEITS